MLVRVLNNDESISEVPVHFDAASGKLAAFIGMMRSKYEKTNKFRESFGIPPRDLDTTINGIVGAEAPFTVLDDDGNALKEVNYCRSYDFWNMHA